MDLILETERLIVRALMPEDAPAMFLMDSDAEVHRYVGKKPVTHVDETRAVIEYVRQQYTDNGIGRWAMLLKENNEFVGWTGFKRMQEEVNGHDNFIDFGYRLTRKYWGKGLATEGAGVALQYGINVLGYRDIYAMTDVANGASRHILEGLGFRLIELFAYGASPGWREPGELTTWYRYFGNEELRKEG